MHRVSYETGKSNLSRGFIGGYLSAIGTFSKLSGRCGQPVYSFQVKTTKDNLALLQEISNFIGLKPKIRLYKQGKYTVALLQTRSRHELITKIIPILDGEILGTKLTQYELWKKDLLNDTIQ